MIEVPGEHGRADDLKPQTMDHEMMDEPGNGGGNGDDDDDDD
jgi:hypothetical protein